MAVICPTVTEQTEALFDKYLKKLAKFAPRVHLDFADGVLAPRRLLDLSSAKWPDDLAVDLHLMYQHPQQYLETVLQKRPQTTIIHAEASGDLKLFLSTLKEAGLGTGLAILPQTTVAIAKELISFVDHVLVFGGRLGWQGSDSDLSQLNKIESIRNLNPRAELAWDGGVNDVNIRQVLDHGVTVVNVGGFIKNNKDHKDAYAILQQIADKY